MQNIVSNNTVSRSVTIVFGHYFAHGDGKGHSSTTVNVHPYIFQCVL